MAAQARALAATALKAQARRSFLRLAEQLEEEARKAEEPAGRRYGEVE